MYSQLDRIRSDSPPHMHEQAQVTAKQNNMSYLYIQNLFSSQLVNNSMQVSSHVFVEMAAAFSCILIGEIERL